MAIYNIQPRPRALVVNITEEELPALGINDLFPTIKSIYSHNLPDIRQQEFDVAIIFHEDGKLTLEPHLNVVCLGTASLENYKSDSAGTIIVDVKPSSSVSTEFIIEEDLQADFESLTKDTLLPIFMSNERHAVLSARHARPTASGVGFTSYNLWVPLIKDGDGKALAGYYRRVKDLPSELWHFPSLNNTDLKKWLKVLLKHWAFEQPETFGHKNGWKLKTKWQTADEKQVKARLDAEIKAFAAQKAAHQRTIDAITDEYKLAQESADKEYRVLLTAKGDELKAAVLRSFTKLGFAVSDSDVDAKKGDLLEDLQVSVPAGFKPWLSLVEIRGYKNGAKLSDLLRIGRFVGRYQKEHQGTPPDAVWYVVNHSLEADPDEREIPLASKSEEVKEFAAANQGLVIDTRELLILLVAVDEGKFSPEQARQMLISQTGYFRIKKLVTK